MKQQHHPYDVRLFTKRANRDLEKELLQLAEGEYIDACNFRTDSMDGNSGVAKKISGEVLLYPNIDNRCIDGTGAPLSATYECIGREAINGHIVEFWADSLAVDPSLIRIDGKIVLMSADFPILTAFPLQTEKNESCIGGEVFITDFNTPPMLFNIADLMANSGMIDDEECTTKYFADFNLAQFQLILSSPVDHPAFIKNTSSSSGINKVFGTGGLSVGYYTYQLSLVTTDGDRTGWSVPTPLIPVVQRLTSECSPAYAWSQTHSKDPDIANPSPFGNHIRFRVNNLNNFDFIQIRRNRWNLGDPLTAPPVSEVIGFVDLVDGEISIYDILDNGNQSESVLSIDEALESLSAVNKAKAIRYYNGRIYLGNVEYASKDITGEVEVEGELTLDGMFPTIQKTGTSGHKDTYKLAHNKSYIAGEKYGFGIVVYDDNSGNSYAKAIPGFENYQFPNRRDPITAITQGSSYFGAVEAADTNGAVNLTHEVFDTVNCVVKTDLCRFTNILDKDLPLADAGQKKGDLEDYTNDLGVSCPISAGGIYVTAHDVGYSPFTPVSQDDTDCAGTDMRINTYVSNDVIGKQEYNPKGFSPEYFSTGIALKGVTKLPSWGKSFSLVRTKPAQRVVAQGLAFYSLNPADTGFGANTTKNTDEIWFYAPDIDQSIGLNPGAIDAILATLANYEMQFVSPLGFFTEVYSFKNNVLTGDEGVDMITYARVLKDLYNEPASAGVMNPYEHAGAGITSGLKYYTGFGKWRNNVFNANYPAAGSGNTTFGITDIQVVNEGTRGAVYLKVKLATSLYSQPGAGGAIDGDNPAVQNWHEPIYVANLVRKNVDVPDTNVTEYVRTGHYQKVDALIGVSDGTDNQQMILVDERWEDCMAVTNGMVAGFNDYSSLYRFIFIQDTALNRRRWVNIYNRSVGEVASILTQLQTSGSAVVTDTSGSYTVYGVYTQNETTDFTCPVYSVVFSHFDTAYNIDFFIPTTGYSIYVGYDNRIPIRFWGGDANVGEAVCAYQDNQYNLNGNPSTGADNFRLNLAFPYRVIELNPRNYIVGKTKLLMSLDPFIQSQNEFKFDNAVALVPANIRQLLAMFTCEARVNFSYAFNDEATKHSSSQFFPLKNYVMRPYRWDNDKFADGAAATYADNNIWPAYEDSYGNEFELWGWGGFRFLPQVNLDYSKDDNSGQRLVSVPDVGFEEKNAFCTRIIWSLKRPINAQNTPSIRTFPGANYFDISDNIGEIKFLWDGYAGKNGNNLFAFTDRGICMVLVDKRIISEINGNELTTAASDIGGIQDQYWISKDTGMNDEMWRTAADFQNTLFFTNKNSAYMFNGAGAPLDIGRQGYHSKLYPEYLRDFPAGYNFKLAGAYDVLHNEYWITFQENNVTEVEKRLIVGTNSITDTDVSINETLLLQPTVALGYIVFLGGIDNDLLTHPVTVCLDDTAPGAQVQLVYKDADGNTIPVALLNENECCYVVPSYEQEKPTWYLAERFDCPTLAYSAPNESVQKNNAGWMGGYDYAFDKYLSIDNKTYGFRNLETYELGKGFKINGENIEGVLWTASSKDLQDDKEFIRVRINSNRKPTKVEFFNTMDQAVQNNVQAELDTVTNPLALKDYNGFEQYIPRKTAPPKDRVQGRLAVYKIMHNLAEEFKVISTQVQAKKLK